MTSNSSPTKSSKDSSRANEIVSASSMGASSSNRSSPTKQPSIAATSKNSEASSSAKEPAAQSMAEIALSWLTPTAAVVTAAVSTTKTPTTSTPDVKLSEKKLDAMDSKMNKNIGKIQEQVSRDLVIPEEIQEDVSFNSMLSDAAYFSNVAASTLAAAGKLAVDSLNPCETDAATVSDNNKKVPAKPKTPTVAVNKKKVPAKPKTPEEIAAEWRQKRRAKEARRSELVYDSSPYSYLTDNAFAAGSEDDDDKTQVV
eukprot:CAMPEP_0119027632 /NCGR_PEP_ID=MMETSP1176-20130426/37448_1 /TAXON_ID=265551 /ORGANISM="Synedropsis recta cf, Strain CCMP1620" /LENGTH=255 /DNA_ID=CAMNT_0006983589 /DNA_START=31 /DNA_END=794 /DNA_ORIENTATION=+